MGWWPAKKTPVWSHATFDIPALATAYRNNDLETPWHYRDARDIRTLTDLFNSRAALKSTASENECPHNALADAIYEAKYITTMLRTLTNG